MKRQLSLSILLAALAAPAAMAGSDIVKCVDGAGRVTLTDQPCDTGAATVRLASMPADEGFTRVEAAPVAVEQAVLPPAAVQRRQVLPRVKPIKPMMRDVATLKAARAQFLLGDATAGRHTLATLD
ncbi:DUF4124 domain-containing protein [Massilia yuzhufengensis]|uniref:DUF4124 domain-containing protein n=1 Tax=Massilia yuzhufengensis TaxID=1164594 RepID=A0A1I1GV88_9BURK|nr:DUF4124 domain-containing protein [Massilia yuzhufengensis]SFC13093.1 protein of unknown function [Massilia yuzhufengensis]